MANFLSFVILCFLLYGRRLPAHHRQLHAWWMSGVIMADLALIVGLVVGRNALDKIEYTMPILLYIHLAFAMTTVVLYGCALVVGVRLLRGHSQPGAMRGLDRLIVPIRTLTLVTSILLQVTHSG